MDNDKIETIEFNNETNTARDLHKGIYFIYLHGYIGGFLLGISILTIYLNHYFIGGIILLLGLSTFPMRRKR